MQLLRILSIVFMMIALLSAVGFATVIRARMNSLWNCLTLVLALISVSSGFFMAGCSLFLFYNDFINHNIHTYVVCVKGLSFTNTDLAWYGAFICFMLGVAIISFAIIDFMMCRQDND